MKHFLIVSLFTLAACMSQKTPKHYYSYTDIDPTPRKDVLTIVYSTLDTSKSRLLTPCGYKNSKGQIVIPIGKYSQCFTDTFKTYAIVMDKKLTDSKIVAIDRNEHIIFDIYMFDNRPDNIQDGLFRIKRNGKIGYANKKGEIIIYPKFACADAFQDGKARVSYKCSIVQYNNDPEHLSLTSDSWFYIDTKGKITQ